MIYNDQGNEVKQEDIVNLKNAYNHLTILSFSELQERGKNNSVDPVPPKPEDLCCIMYTSGSTGAPKGVLLKHRNVIAALAGVDVIVGPYIGPGDGLLTYLPLAHILEFVFENAVLYWGGTMGYGNAMTLSDASVRKCKGDTREFRPTILVARLSKGEGGSCATTGCGWCGEWAFAALSGSPESFVFFFFTFFFCLLMSRRC